MRFHLLIASTLLVSGAAYAQSAEPDAGPPAGSEATADGGAPQGVLTKAPSIVKFVEAQFPPEAQAQGISGTVKLQVDISETGAVQNVVVLEPAGHGFDEAALAAVKQFVFSPAEIDGKPAAVRITYNYNFTYKPAAPPEVQQAKQEGPVNFSGVVRERGTRKLLPNVEVALPDSGRIATTDEQGHFEFRDVPIGEVKVSIVVANFDRFETKERIDAGKETRATYYLLPRFFSQFETVVRGRKERKEVSQTTLQAEEVQRVPGTSGDSLKVVQNLPGVARAPFNGGAIIIRGTSPNDSGIYLDGERIPLLYHFGGLTAVYNSDLLESIDYLPGNYSSYYGDQIGGVVDVKSRSPRSDQIHGYANLNLVDTSLLIEGPIAPGLTFAIAGRRSYIDQLLKLAPASVTSDLSVAPKYYDAQLKLEWKPNSKHTFTLLALTDDDVLGLLVQRPANNDPNVAGRFNLEDGFTQVRLRHQYRSESLHLDTTILGGPAFFDAAIGAQRAFKLYAHVYNFRHTAEYEVRPWMTVAGGLDVYYSRATLESEIQRPRLEGETQQPGAIAEVIKANFYTFYYYPSAWAELRLQPIPGLLVVPGLRSEGYIFHDQKSADHSWSPRLGVRYQLTPQIVLKGGAGVYHGAAAQYEPAPIFGNPDIKSKTSNQYSLGVEYNPTPEILASVEGYYNDLHDLIVSNPAGLNPALINDGVGRVYGVDVLVRHALTRRFFGWIAYSLSRSERRDHPGEDWRLFDNDQTHVLTLIASYKLPRGWQIGGRFRYVSGNPSTPVVGAVRNDNSDVFIPYYGASNSERLPAFNQLDIRVDKTWVYDTWNLDLFLDLQNAYNHASIEGVTYSYDYRQRGYFRGLPLLPVLGLKGSF